MKSLIVNGIAGVGLFVGALAGGLVATGRWNHEGVANIPLLNSMFPAPAETPAGGDGEAKDANVAADGAKDATHGASHDAATEASADAAASALDGTHTANPQDPKKLPLPKPGKSLFSKEEKKSGGHGEEAPAEGHGADPAKADHGQQAAQDPAGHAPAPAAETKPTSMPERDFAHVGKELQHEPGVRYQPGALFRFEGLPAGVTPEQLNAAWKRVQDGLAEIERRTKAVEIKEQELREFSEDLARRQTEVGKERAEVEGMHRRLDERIEQFQDQIKLVRNDEVAGLKRNAQHLANFEPTKAVEIITDQWKTDAGQVEVLKLLEFMSKDDVDEILGVMPTALVRDVMQKRLKVTKEPTPAATPKK